MTFGNIMKLNKFTYIGAIAIVSCFAMNMANAGNCSFNQSDVQTAFSIEKADGSIIDGQACVSAIAQGVKTFDSKIDSIINNKHVAAAFDSMNEEAKTNPEAKKLQQMYRSERATFVNDYLVSTNQDKLPTKSNGLRQADGGSEKKMESYLDTKQPFNSEKVKDLREKFINQAKASIKNSLN